MKGATFTRWTRLALAGQGALLVVLALAAVVLVVEMAERPALRVRLDLTQESSSSLDPATAGVIRALPQRAEVDVFFRPTPEIERVMLDALTRTRQLLELAADQVPDKLSIRFHDANDLVQARGRMDELRVIPSDLAYGRLLAAAVVSVGERRTVVRFFPDMGNFDLGDPARGVPPRLVDWRGEEALAEALGRVSGDRAPKVVVAQGHDELLLAPASEGGLFGLLQALQNEGYEFDTWDAANEPAVPADADVLLLAGPEQPYTPRALAAIRAYVENGGRVLAAAGSRFVEGEGGMSALLEPYGARLVPGFVCVEVFNPSTGEWFDGLNQCGMVVLQSTDLAATHPITAPLHERGRPLELWMSQSFQRGSVPSGGTLVDLASSPEGAWRDLPDADGRANLRRDAGREQVGRHILAVALDWVGSSTKRSRIVAIGAAEPLARQFEADRDFVLNAFDWLVERDFRVRVRPRDAYAARIDRNDTALLALVTRTAWFGVPGLCALIGGFLAFRRRR